MSENRTSRAAVADRPTTSGGERDCGIPWKAAAYIALPLVPDGATIEGFLIDPRSTSCTTSKCRGRQP